MGLPFSDRFWILLPLVMSSVTVLAFRCPGVACVAPKASHDKRRSPNVDDGSSRTVSNWSGVGDRLRWDPDDDEHD